MKKVGIAVLMYVLFLKLLASNVVSQYSYSTYSRSSSDAFLWVPLIIFGIFALIFLVYILIAIWVYKDAKKRGENGILWALLVVVGGLIVIIIWFVIRPPIGGRKTSPDRRCPNCGRGIPFDSRACPYCGKRFETFL